MMLLSMAATTAAMNEEIRTNAKKRSRLRRYILLTDGIFFYVFLDMEIAFFLCVTYVVSDASAVPLLL